MTTDTMIGVDLANSMFQLHGTMTGQLKFRKKLSRPNFFKFMAEQSPAVVVMEACGMIRGSPYQPAASDVPHSKA